MLGAFAMFTFGRDHERRCALQYLHNPNDAPLITDVIDAVHDVLDGKASLTSIRPIITRAFSEGGSGVWEQTGSWLRNLAYEYPELASLWNELSTNSDGKVRFRVACCMRDIPQPLALEIGSRLKEDRHKKTREMAQSRLDEVGD